MSRAEQSFFSTEYLAQAVDAEGRESRIPQPGAGGMGRSLLAAGVFQGCTPFRDAHFLRLTRHADSTVGNFFCNNNYHPLPFSTCF